MTEFIGYIAKTFRNQSFTVFELYKIIQKTASEENKKTYFYSLILRLGGLLARFDGCCGLFYFCS